MSQIKVQTDSLQILRTTIQQQSDVMQQISAVISQIQSQLDMEISSREQVEQNLIRLRRNADTIQEQLSGLGGAVGTANDQFVETDRRLVRQAEPMFRQMEQTGRVVTEQGRRMSGSELAALSELFGLGVGLEQAVLDGIGWINQQIEQTKDRIQEAILDFLKGDPLPPVSRDSIVQALAEGDPAQALGQYSYSIKFINDVNGLEVFLYGTKNWKETLKAVAAGGLSLDAIAQEFMNDPDKCRPLLRSVIDELSGTEYLDIIPSDGEKALEIVQNLAESCGFDSSAAMMESINGWVGDAELADKMMKDYTQNVALLESLKDSVPAGSVLDGMVDELIWEYQNQAASVLVDDIKAEAEKGVVNMVDYVSGLKFGQVDAAIQKALGKVDQLDFIDTVVCTGTMRADAIRSLRNAASVIQSGNFTDADLANYANAFDVAKSLTITQYEAMADYYPSGSKEAELLEEQLRQLKGLSCDHFL